MVTYLKFCMPLESIGRVNYSCNKSIMYTPTEVPLKRVVARPNSGNCFLFTRGHQSAYNFFSFTDLVLTRVFLNTSFDTNGKYFRMGLISYQSFLIFLHIHHSTFISVTFIFLHVLFLVWPTFYFKIGHNWGRGCHVLFLPQSCCYATKSIITYYWFYSKMDLASHCLKY